MNLYKSEQWTLDLRLGLLGLAEVSKLEFSRVLITGAGGLIGSAVVDLLIQYNETHTNKINIIVAGRTQDKMKARFHRYMDKSYMEYAYYDANVDEDMLLPRCDYIICCAGIAHPRQILEKPVETMTGNFIGMKKILKFAQGCNARKVVYVSSSEVYGLKDGFEPYREDEYGYIDILNPRNSYSLSKRATETLCISFADEYGMDVSIIRPGHIYGPSAQEEDSRVSSLFAYNAARGQDIILKSDGLNKRSYCYCVDCATAILKVLLCGKSKEAYNVSSKVLTISIKQMAEYLAQAGNVLVKCAIPTKQEVKGFNPMNNSILNGNKIGELGWKEIFLPEEGLKHTVKILKEATY